MQRAVAVLAFALAAALIVDTGVAGAAAPFAVPNVLEIGSVHVVPAPCQPGPDEQMEIEFDPMFPSSTYYIHHLPAPVGETIKLVVPPEAVPGPYILRGICYLDGASEVGSDPSSTIVAIDPKEVELIAKRPRTRRARPAAATQGDPQFTG